jgi:hypothetical protein
VLDYALQRQIKMKFYVGIKYAEGFENRAREIRSQDSSVTDPTARS